MLLLHHHPQLLRSLSLHLLLQSLPVNHQHSLGLQPMQRPALLPADGAVARPPRALKVFRLRLTPPTHSLVRVREGVEINQQRLRLRQPHQVYSELVHASSLITHLALAKVAAVPPPPALSRPVRQALLLAALMFPAAAPTPGGRLTSTPAPTVG